MSIEGQGHFFTIYIPGFVCFVLYKAKISGERLQHHWSSGFLIRKNIKRFYLKMNIFTTRKTRACLRNEQWRMHEVLTMLEF